MLIVPNKPPESTWTPVMGSEWLFDPIDRSMLIRARRAAREVSQAEAVEGAEPASAIDMIEEMGDAMTRALILEGAKGWRGVCVQSLDEGGEPRFQNGEPLFDVLPFTPENLLLVLSDPIAVDAIEEVYVMPFVLRERERAEPGNAFAASPTGTGEAATPDSDSATSRAKRKRAGGAPRVRTSSKSPAPRRKRTSGGS